MRTIGLLALLCVEIKTYDMLGLIVARGGSKRLAGKNTKSFFGKPLIACTIEVAKDSGVFERLIVVTDDLKIAEIAKEYGAEVPFMEPAELAGDATDRKSVV